jgi:hypothetical protein
VNGEEVDVDDYQSKKSKNDDIFLKPKALKAINFDIVKPSDMNSTFDVDIQPLKNLPGTSSNRVPMSSSSSSTLKSKSLIFK